MTATQPPLLDDEQGTPGASWPAGWYVDPADRSAKRYWDGSQWTQHFARPSTPSHATPPQSTPVASDQPKKSGGFYAWIRRRPALAFWSTLGIALILGIALGAASAEQEKASSTAGESERVSQLSSQLDETRSELDGVKGTLSDTEDDLDGAKEKLSTTREKLRDARADAQAQPAPAPPAEEPSSGGSTTAKSFSGNGTKNLGTITITEESVLKWTNDGLIFIVSDDGFTLNLSSDASSGDTVLQPGTYKNVEVSAEGNWTMEIDSR